MSAIATVWGYMLVTSIWFAHCKGVNSIFVFAKSIWFVVVLRQTLLMGALHMCWTNAKPIDVFLLGKLTKAYFQLYILYTRGGLHLMKTQHHSEK